MGIEFGIDSKSILPPENTTGVNIKVTAGQTNRIADLIKAVLG